MADTISDPSPRDDEATRLLKREQSAHELPRSVGPYEVIRSLGEGGMGIVLLARDKELHRDVALKFVRRELLQNESFLERFLREARLCAALNHPNIVTTYQVGKHDGAPYIVLEYVEGRTLRDLLRTPPPLKVSRILDIIAQACDGLEVAARRGIVHRDIKPANIMVRHDGLVKVMDFGLSKELEGDKLTVTSALIGTPDYMSPEQAAGKPLDFRTDIYALGITMFQCLTGYLPFKSSSVFETIRLHAERPLPEDPRVTSIANGQLHNLIRSMTAKRADERPGSYAIIRTELRTLRDRLEADGTDLTTSSPRAEIKGEHLHDVIQRSDAEAREQEAKLPSTKKLGSSSTVTVLLGGGKRYALGTLAAITLLATGAITFSMFEGKRKSRQDDSLVRNSVVNAPSAKEPPLEVAAPVRDVMPGPVKLVSSRNRTSTAADVLFAAGSFGSNHMLSEKLRPESIPVLVSFTDRTPLDVLEALCLAAGWTMEEKDGIEEIAPGGADPVAQLLRLRERLDAAQLPKVSVNSVSSRVSLRMFCDAMQRDTGLDYLIVGAEVADAAIPSGSFTRQPLPFMMELINKRSIPIEWTVHKSTLIIVPVGKAK